MTTPVRAPRGALMPSLILGAAVVAAVSIAGWLLLLFVKGTVVLISYGLGIALVVVPLVLAHRIVAGHTGSDRWGRVGTIAQVVALGVALCVIARLVGDHGWLLIVVPAAIVGAGRLIRALRSRRRVAVH